MRRHAHVVDRKIKTLVGFQTHCSAATHLSVHNGDLVPFLCSQLDVIHTVKHAQVPQAHAQENSIFQPQGDKVPIRLDQNMGSSSVYKPGRTVPGSE